MVSILNQPVQQLNYLPYTLSIYIIYIVLLEEQQEFLS